jgi:hypothetical protein
VQLSKEELDLVFPIFDRNNSGEISYKQFAEIIVGDIAKATPGGGRRLMSKTPAFHFAMHDATIKERKRRIKDRTKIIALGQQADSLPNISAVHLPREISPKSKQTKVSGLVSKLPHSINSNTGIP